ncbi:hypothetical protein F2981_22785 (plasmid) [Sinorhizobium meliloti]|nr:hypothetical protein [Sinorhizobium meliloti]
MDHRRPRRHRHADCPLAVSYDLHGNVSQRIIDQVRYLSRPTGPPRIIDTRETHGAGMVDAGGNASFRKRPGVAWAPVRLLFPEKRTSTEDEPGRASIAILPEFDRRPASSTQSDGG